jgi:HTH-type transcriptional regulator/antitoxin HigA
MKYKVIKSKEQYDQYCAIIEQLLITNSNADEIELVTLLIESWDHEHDTFGQVDNVTLLRFLMQEHGLRHTDLADIVGVGPRMITEILNCKRPLPSGTARKLAEHFKLSEEVFAIAKTK